MVIAGAGHAGVQAAIRLAEANWPGQIVLVDEQDGTPYQRPPLSKEFLTADSLTPVPALRTEDYFRDKGIRRIVDRLIEVDAAHRVVSFEASPSLRYSHLILATGSEVRRLNVPGAEKVGVHYLRTLSDAERLRDELRTGPRVAIVGAGYIGLEIAAACTSFGTAPTVLEAADRVMSRTTSHVVAQHFQTLHQSRGGNFVFGATVTGFVGGHRVEGVRTADGAIIPADIVVVGVGVRPRESIAKAAGLRTDDGVIVNVDGATSDPHIYAAGDVARVRWPAGESRRLESVPNAQMLGMNAANAILGGDPAKSEVPWFWTVQHGVRLQTAGLWHAEDEIIVRGDLGDGTFSVLYVRDGQLAALDAVGGLKDFSAGRRLIAARTKIDTRRAADSSIKLLDAVSL